MMRQEALVNPSVLVWARESINMDLDEAAQKIGVKPERLAMWEAGERRPTITQARNISKVYRRPLATLYLPAPPTDLGFSVPHDFRRLPVGQPAEPSPELISELRRIEYLRQVAIDLADGIDPRPDEFMGRTRVGESAQQVSQRILDILKLPVSRRRHWRSDYDALNGWKHAIEDAGVLVMHLRRVETEEVRGIALAESPYPVIAINGKDTPYGRVFSLLHEFVHLMLGATGMANMRIAANPRNQDQRIERFCNLVAGETLVPRGDLLGQAEVAHAHANSTWPDETIQKYSRRYGVSREVVVRRLLLLGKTNEVFYRQKRKEYAAQLQKHKRSSGGPSVPVRVLLAIGRPFAQLALDAYHREAISSSDLSELFGAKVKHVPAVEALLTSGSGGGLT